MKKDKISNVDDYLAQFPSHIKEKLQQLRGTIKNAAPHAEEVISYQMPAYRQQDILVYFAAFQHHIGFYPTPAGIDAFRSELSVYKSAKGSVQFPHDKPLPLALISEIVKFRVKEDQEKQ